MQNYKTRQQSSIFPIRNRSGAHAKKAFEVINKLIPDQGFHTSVANLAFVAVLYIASFCFKKPQGYGRSHTAQILLRLMIFWYGILKNADFFLISDTWYCNFKLLRFYQVSTAGSDTGSYYKLPSQSAQPVPLVQLAISMALPEKQVAVNGHASSYTAKG